MSAAVPELRAALVAAAAANAAAFEGARAANAEREAASAAHGGRWRRVSRKARNRGIGGGLAIAFLVGAGFAGAGKRDLVPQFTMDAVAARAVLPIPRPTPRINTRGELDLMIERLRHELPYPPHMVDRIDPDDMMSEFPSLERPSVPASELVFPMEMRALCIWKRYLMQVHEAGDTAAERQGLAVLDQMQDWPSFRGAKTDPTRSWLIADQLHAAQRGDFKPLDRELRGECATWTMYAPADQVEALRKKLGLRPGEPGPSGP